MASSRSGGSLSSFARSNGLAEGTNGELPAQGGLLGRSGLVVDSSAHGALPGGCEGAIAHCTYETRSNDSTTTHRKTAVVLEVPEAMGYAPFLRIGGGVDLSISAAEARRFEPAEGVTVLADKGIDEGWLHEAFSPAFNEWLQRSPEDFGAEYTAGILVVARNLHLTDPAALEGLCTDAARIAGVLREEALEDSESGGSKAARNTKVDHNARIAEGVIAELGPGRPENVESELAAASAIARRDGGTFARTIKLTILWLIGINVIGGGIYGLLLNLGNPLLATLVYQVIVIAIVAPLAFRSVSKSVATIAAEEAFYRGYAEANSLTALEPLAFAAEYAGADLPGKPLRAFEGVFGGRPGVLMTTGNGRTRGDRIVLVRGIRGPTASTELNVSAPGISTKALDECVELLVLDLETAPAPAD